MRASAGGYYANLNRMYRYLDVPMHPVRFLFVFAKALKQRKMDIPITEDSEASCSPSAAASAVPGGYFIHASNHHQIPPPRPSGCGPWWYLLEVLYLIICHTWFTAACFLVRPGRDETFSAYLARTWVPRRYATHYALPLLSSVCTCSHAQLLAFPAGDLVAYVRRSHRQPHYAVCGGVRQVQARLARGIEDVRVRARVLRVAPQPGGGGTGRVCVRWRAAAPTSSSSSSTGETGAAGTEPETAEEIFDRVVLAVSPDVAGRLFAPLQKPLAAVPTVWVESSVLAAPVTSSSSTSQYSHSLVEAQTPAACMHHQHPNNSSTTTSTDADTSVEQAQVITLRTQFAGPDGPRSEALHALPGGAVVSTCALDLDGGSDREQQKKRVVLKTAGFTRTLRTVESRAAVERIMGGGGNDAGNGWVNGQDNVWLAGAWCWDGMVLLEGCVVSAMRVADDFGVEVPWREGR